MKKISKKNRKKELEKLYKFKAKKESLEYTPQFNLDDDGALSLVEPDNVFMSAVGASETMNTVNNDLQHVFIKGILSLRDSPTSEFLNGGLAFLHGMQPRDEAEVMLIIQMYMTHNLSMNAGASMSRCENIEINDTYISRIIKLSKAFRDNLEALNKHRGKGQQKVTVEHVNVHEGGQAVVGNVLGGGNEEV